MGKLEKYGEQARGYYPKKRDRKRRLTKEKKEEIIEKFDRLVEHNVHLHDPLQTSKLEQAKDEEWERQEIELCVHSEKLEKNGFLVCRICGKKLKKLQVKKGFQEKFIDLFCTHRETIEKDGYILCKKCGAKFPKREV